MAIIFDDQMEGKESGEYFHGACGCSFSMLCDILFSCFRHMRYVFDFKGIDTHHILRYSHY